LSGVKTKRPESLCLTPSKIRGFGQDKAKKRETIIFKKKRGRGGEKENRGGESAFAYKPEVRFFVKSNGSKVAFCSGTTKIGHGSARGGECLRSNCSFRAIKRQDSIKRKGDKLG